MIRLLNLLKIVSVGLFNKYLFKIIIVSSCLAIIYGNNKMSEVSNVDYSFLKNKESQFNLGYTSNGSVNYSIDKFISNNLIGSAKVSIIDVDYFKLINQFTLKFLSERYPFSIFFGYNHYHTELKSNSWMNFAPVVEFIYNKKYLSAFGVNYNLSGNNLFYREIIIFCEFKTILSKDSSISLGLNINPNKLLINKTIELNIEI